MLVCRYSHANGMPVVFSWPVLTSTVTAQHFLITLSNGSSIHPEVASVSMKGVVTQLEVETQLQLLARHVQQQLHPRSRRRVCREAVDWRHDCSSFLIMISNGSSIQPDRGNVIDNARGGARWLQPHPQLIPQRCMWLCTGDAQPGAHRPASTQGDLPARTYNS